MRTILDQLDRLGIAAAVLEENRRFVEANRQLAAMLSLAAGEFVGTDVGEVLATKAKDRVDVGLTKVYRFDAADHSPWYRLDLKSPGNGLIGILTDVGSEYEPREEVREYNTVRDRLLLDGKIGTWRYDPDAELYYFSSELSLGHRGAGSAVPVPLLKLLQHPDDSDKDTQIRERITREGGFANAEMRYRAADGSWTHLNVHYRAGRRLASGHFEMFGISQDITPVALARDEANRLSGELREALAGADYANRSKTQFLANMSHELRTPLNAILGFSEMIEGAFFGPIGPKYVEYARDIHRSGQLLLELVNDVLDLAKLDAGKLELHESEVAVPALIEECLVLVRGRAKAGRIALSTDLSSDARTLRADPRAVKQILLNLLSNAIKFTPEEGRVSVLSRIAEDGSLSLSVRDSGIGMKPSDVATALAPFGQIDSRLSRRHQGTGLGLSISKALLELHGGAIAIESEPDIGTTVTAVFPANRARATIEQREAG
jgi:signal transduction histidine kinase